MFRHFTASQAADQVNLIRRNAEIIQDRYYGRTLSSKLALLIHAIKEFEANRTLDYLTDNNDRAMLVLHAANVVSAHTARHHLKPSVSLEGEALLSNLNDYLKDVTVQIQEVITSLNKLAFLTQQTSKLEREKLIAQRYQQQLLVKMREETLNSLLIKAAQSNGYDYFGITDSALESPLLTQPLPETNNDVLVKIDIDGSETVELFSSADAPDSENESSGEYHDLSIHESRFSDNDDAEDEQDTKYVNVVSEDDEEEVANEVSVTSGSSRESSDESAEQLPDSDSEHDSIKASWKASSKAPLSPLSFFFSRHKNSPETPIFEHSGHDSEYSPEEMEPLLPRNLF